MPTWIQLVPLRPPGTTARTGAERSCRGEVGGRERAVRLRQRAARGDHAGEPAGRDWHHRWVVHKVRQWYPGELRHKVIYRGPYVRSRRQTATGWRNCARTGAMISSASLQGARVDRRYARQHYAIVLTMRARSSQWSSCSSSIPPSVGPEGLLGDRGETVRPETVTEPAVRRNIPPAA